MTRLPPDRVVSELTRLARRTLTGEPPTRDDHGLQRLEATLAARRDPRSFAGLARPGFALAFAGALFVALWLAPGWLRRSPAITYRVLNGAIVSGYVLGSAETRIRFSDGSDVALSPGAETKVAELSAHGGRMNLRNGSARFAIAHQPKAAWSVEAGPYTVRVTGTAFDVRWSSSDQLFELALHSGSVIVIGPSGTNVKLAPGQRLSGDSSGKIRVEGPRVGSPAARLPESNAAAPSDERAGPAATATATSAPSASSNANSPARSAEATAGSSWSRKVATGQFNAVIADAERRGLQLTYSSASSDELSALADAARYASRTNIAKQALLAQRQRFSDSPTAREAAFLLGRLAESEGGAALEWYARYLKESPDGPYAAQAMGRRMMLVYKEGGARAAGPLASEYLRRFPSGSYASAAQKILGEAPSATAP